MLRFISQSNLEAELRKEFPGRVRTSVPLSSFSRWGIGGPADIIVHPASLEELSRMRELLAANGAESIVIGGTSNLLFSDKGLRAVCIVIGKPFSQVSVKGNMLEAGAGVWVPKLARDAMKAGLSGLEHVCGIPGSLGGLVYMNGGSQRRCIADAVKAVATVDSLGRRKVRTAEDCRFRYRGSVFQALDEVITGVQLYLPHRKPSADIRLEMLGILKSRRIKFPRRLPNCGSVFISDPAMYEEYGPPGEIIERLGFKGVMRGGAQVSSLHANFIVNRGGAKAANVLALIKEIRQAVLEATGHSLKAEVRYVSETGKIIPADQAG